ANFRSPQPQLAYEGGPFQVLALGRPWECRDPARPRRAAVSAFGFGGINAHVLLEEYAADRSLAATRTAPPAVSVPAVVRDTKPEAERPAIAIVGMGAH